MNFVKTYDGGGKIFHTERVLILITPAISFQEMHNGSVHILTHNLCDKYHIGISSEGRPDKIDKFERPDPRVLECCLPSIY